MPRPDLSRVPEWYHKYINKVQEDDLLKALADQRLLFMDFLQNLPVEKREFKYAPGKWSIQELLQHIIDAERVFAYRALSFARFDPNPLPGFEEDEWAKVSGGSSRNWYDLLEEFSSLRQSTEWLFASFSEAQLEASGIASKHSNYVRAIGFIIAGHIDHHVEVIRERYL